MGRDVCPEDVERARQIAKDTLATLFHERVSESMKGDDPEAQQKFEAYELLWRLEIEAANHIQASTQINTGFAYGPEGAALLEALTIRPPHKEAKLGEYELGLFSELGAVLMLQKERNFERAIDVLRKVAGNTPSGKPAQTKLCELLAERGVQLAKETAEPDRAIELLLEGLDLYASKGGVQMRHLTKAAESIVPIYVRAIDEETSAKLTQVATILERILAVVDLSAVKDELVTVYMRLADTKWAEEGGDAAIDNMIRLRESALKLASHNQDLSNMVRVALAANLSRKAYIFYQNNQNADGVWFALAILDRALEYSANAELRSFAAIMWVILGNHNAHAKQYANAKNSYSRALQLDPTNQDAIHNLSLLQGYY
jgi:tetratricopeptide (TPR) repeat protein